MSQRPARIGTARALRRWALAATGLALVAALAFACVQCHGPGRRPAPPAPTQRQWTADKLAAFDQGQGAFAGLPRSSRPVTVLRNSVFIVGYDEARKCPLWVVYRVDGPPRHETLERPSRFRIDDRTRARVSHDAYTNSGFDRGHMAPNYAIYSRHGREAQLETFLMTNVCPQTPDLNRRRWNELEQRVAGPAAAGRSWAERYLAVWVVTGPIFDDDPTHLPSGVEIPDAFYKILLEICDSRHELRSLAFILPNAPRVDGALESFLVSIAEVESRTGLDFFHMLDDDLERALESVRAPALWN